jgi:hypothetical protein
MFSFQSKGNRKGIYVYITITREKKKSRDSVVGITTGYGLDDGGVRVQVPIQWVPGTLSSRVNWRSHEADHSPPTSAKVKQTWIYTSTSLYIFMT